ncbi:MAG: hypothetical protein KIT84_40105 [Labilithrix sp.]|nr:hypothetical protein [Labilithrix sp.]MCW5817270.1 hypothetical protein [Labilithrix sp.]
MSPAMIPITYDALVELTVGRGVPSRAAAELAVRTTLAMLGQLLTDDEAAFLARRLAPELARLLERSEADVDVDERAQVVLRVLGESVDEDARRLLVRVLPAELARHLEPVVYGEPEPHRPPSGHTLADGRPGSRRPLSEAGARRDT